ncbi:hypothetical protein PIROE2DRAFT_13388 [Piromyces sp. E2]|nr:hypothetical protein PIROE2DRAFT_13388 [Piromyces sp. E2]|eukprot:OUM60752.1 hypothetical protein PIROE2DRAFT_13388 [Piromyces sp. E2]
MGNKISKADGRIVIAIVNNSLPEKKHIDYNGNNVSNQDLSQGSDIISEITTSSILSQKNTIEEYIYEDDSNRSSLKIEDLIDYNNINLCSKKIIEISPNAVFSTLLNNLNL